MAGQSAYFERNMLRALSERFAEGVKQHTGGRARKRGRRVRGPESEAHKGHERPDPRDTDRALDVADMQRGTPAATHSPREKPDSGAPRPRVGCRPRRLPRRPRRTGSNVAFSKAGRLGARGGGDKLSTSSHDDLVLPRPIGNTHGRPGTPVPAAAAMDRMNLSRTPFDAANNSRHGSADCHPGTSKRNTDVPAKAFAGPGQELPQDLGDLPRRPSRVVIADRMHLPR